MSLLLTLLAAERGKGNLIEVEFLITPSGNYTQGGDTCDLTQLFNQADALGRNIDSDIAPIWCGVQGQAQLPGGTAPNVYDLNTYSNPNNGTPPVPYAMNACKFAVFSGVTEAASAGYTNAVLSDRIIAKCVFSSQR